jgi:hypothetical protein
MAISLFIVEQARNTAPIVREQSARFVQNKFVEDSVRRNPLPNRKRERDTSHVERKKNDLASPQS